MKIYTKSQRAYNAEKIKEIMRDVNVAEIACNLYGLNLYQSRDKGNELKCIEHPNITFDVQHNRVFIDDEGKGMSSFDFVQRYENLSFIDAKQKVIDYYNEKNPNELEIFKYNKRTDSVHVTNGITLPKQANNNEGIKIYLKDNYNIDDTVIDTLIDNKLLYEDYFHNCVFVGYDHNEDAQFAWKLGTGERDYQEVVSGSYKKIGWNYQTSGKNEKVILTDNPLQAVCYINEHLDEDFCVVATASLGSLELTAATYINSHFKDIKEVILHIPNTEANDEVAKNIKNMLVEAGNLNTNVSVSTSQFLPIEKESEIIETELDDVSV